MRPLHGTEAVWVKWLEGKIRARETAVAAYPGELVAAYNREVGYVRDYNGRQLLEMLQNADDAGATGQARPRRTVDVLIMLTDQGLCFANTGQPFTTDGVESLLLTDRSPKRRERHRYIGNRGLGFRSVLNWSETPFVISGDLRLGFSRERAIDWARGLSTHHANLKAELKQERATARRWPVPILYYPLFLDQDGRWQGRIVGGDAFRTAWALAEQARVQGYDTVIGLPFTRPGAFPEALEQLHQLRPDVLLFLRHVRQLTVRLPDRTETWEVRARRDTIEIASSPAKTVIGRWRVCGTKGTIPPEYRSPDPNEPHMYELRIAISQNGPKSAGFLFHYFPTHVRLPLPITVHATLELTNNRQNLVESMANAHIVRKLASFIARVAEFQPRGRDPWSALRLLALTGELDPILDKLGFAGSLMHAGRDRRVIPTLGGGRARPARAFRLRAEIDPYLPTSGFTDIVPWAAEPHLYSTLEQLSVPTLPDAELSRRLARVAHHLSISQRATLITHLIKGNTMPSPAPALLIDQAGSPISAGEEAFLPPSEGKGLPIPSWVGMRILHPSLVQALRRTFSVKDARQLRFSLQPAFRVREYALEPLLTAICGSANHLAHRSPRQEPKVRKEALLAIHALYVRARQGRPVWPSNLAAWLPTRAGRFAPATSLYLGREYPGGEVVGELYCTAAPECVVAPPDQLGLPGGSKVLAEFLRWLGVAKEPRTSPLTCSPSHPFMKVLYQHQTFPLPVSGTTLDGLPELQRMPHSLRVTSIDHLDRVLHAADPHAVIAWVATDPRFDQWEKGDDEAELHVSLPRHRYGSMVRPRRLPSYILWRLAHLPWLPARSGQKVEPRRSVHPRELPRELRSVVPCPALNPKHRLVRRLRLGEYHLDRALRFAGVKLSLDKVDWPDLYRLLAEWPTVDPDGRHARALYRALVGRRVDQDPPDSEERRSFLASGRLYGRCGDKDGYFSISELYYLDSGLVPKVILSHIPLLAVDRKRGSAKIRRLFGVPHLDSRVYQATVSEYQPSDLNAQLSGEFEDLKPFICVQRWPEERYTHADFRRLRSLKLVLCTAVAGHVTLDGDEYPFDLADGEWVLSGGSAYLVSPRHIDGRVLEDVLVADTVGAVLAEVCQAEQQHEFSRLAVCNPSQRRTLLARWLGADVTELLRKYRTILRDGGDPNPVQPREERVWAEPRERPAAPDAPAPEPSSPGSATARREVDAIRNLGRVAVRKRDHVPQPPPRPVQVRIAPRPSAPRSQPDTRRPAADPEVSELLAERFEQARELCPLRVSQVQGQQGFGCDILSFRSEADRDRFKLDPSQSDLVERFVEVKGRNSPTGSIQLAGNELKAAREHGDRYFVYRVHETDRPGQFEMAIIRDPVAAKPIEVKYELNPYRVESTELWDVEEVQDEAD